MGQQAKEVRSRNIIYGWLGANWCNPESYVRPMKISTDHLPEGEKEERYISCSSSFIYFVY